MCVVWQACSGVLFVFFFFKQKTAYEMRISDWSSDVCSSDLGSLPATRVAIAGFDPVFLTAARAAIAGILALILLGMQRGARPSSRDMASLSTVALGVVVGFPLLSALALQHITAARSLVFIGLLPLSTDRKSTRLNSSH